MQVRDVMSAPVITVKPSTTVEAGRTNCFSRRKSPQHQVLDDAGKLRRHRQ